MSVPLRVLILDDSAADESMIRAELRRAGFAPEGPRAETAESFRTHLGSNLDLILAKNELSHWNAIQALELLSQTGWNIPLIVISESFTEEAIARLIEKRAAHCIPKDHLGTLGPAVLQALEQRDYRRETQNALEALRKSESRYRTLVENARDVVFHLDANGRFTLLNQAFEDITRWSRGDWVGCDFSPMVHEEDRERARETFNRTLGGERTDLYELRIAHRDGHYLTGEFIIARQQDESGALSVLGIARDVTYRKKTEDALRKSEERLRHVLENTSDLFWEIDEHGIYVYVSPKIRELLGYRPDEVIGKGPFDLMPEDEGRRIQHQFASISRNRRPFSLLEKINLHQDGHQVILESSGVPVFDRMGTFRGYRGVDRDITERKRLESQVRQSQKMESLGALAGGIAHDFNNLIAIIGGYCEITLEALEDGHPARSYLEQIDTASQRAAEIVQQILTFARKSEVSLKPINLNDAVREIVKILRETFPKTIEISCRLESDLSHILADSTQINQILMNLCVNARDAMPGGGKLLITTGKPGTDDLREIKGTGRAEHYVRMSVSDTGSGMTREARQSIFDPFFTTKEHARRSGLGLAVVHGIMTSHHGHIEVESEPDHGTTFHLYFPASAPAPRQKKKKPDSPRINGGSETLLLVEDEPAISEMMRTALQSRGYSVLTAHDGSEALEIYRENRREISLVVLDLGLPKIDGASVLKEIKNLNPSAVVVVVSGFLDPDQTQHLKTAGAGSFLQKPYELKELNKLVDDTLHPAD